MPLVRPPSSKAHEAEGPPRLLRTPPTLFSLSRKASTTAKRRRRRRTTTNNQQPPSTNRQAPTANCLQLARPSFLTPEAPPPCPASFSAPRPFWACLSSLRQSGGGHASSLVNVTGRVFFTSGEIGAVCFTFLHRWRNTPRHYREFLVGNSRR